MKSPPMMTINMKAKIMPIPKDAKRLTAHSFQFEKTVSTMQPRGVHPAEV
jgi:hypothetical protein